MARMNEEEIRKAIRRHELEDTLKGECFGTINDRVTRYLELDFIKITPNEHWASISAECIVLYRDGYFFACIALCQAVAEAIVRYVFRKNFNRSSSFENSINKLYEKGKVTLNCKRTLGEIWEGRNDYHHLNPQVPTERKKLQDIAKSKLIALHTVESEVFEFEVVDGAIKPKYPEYWPKTNNGLLNVFLRFEP